MASKWSYKNYTDNEETTNAKKQVDTIASQKPGDFTYDDYAESNKVTDIGNRLNSLQAPGEYQSAWQQGIDNTINKILNREKFTYDVNGDALYQQYKDQYVNQGKMAMMDTMGQASAMTGGYGNSYAQSVGQQAYQGYLQQLTDKIPELYQLALDKYNSEGNELYNQYGLLSDRENVDYGRYRDDVSDYNTERNYLTDLYNTERQWDYGLWSDNYDRSYNQHRDDVSDWQYNLGLANDEYWNQRNFGYGQYADDKNLSYSQYRDDIADTQWQANFDEGVRQYDNNLLYDATGTGTTSDGTKVTKTTTGGNGDNGGNEDSGDFKQYTYSGTDEDGNSTFYRDGKKYTYEKGVNPYTGTKNSDTKYGTFNNGYQPNNVGKLKNGKVNKLSPTGEKCMVNGVVQNVWKDLNGKEWYWDGTENRYIEY